MGTPGALIDTWDNACIHQNVDFWGIPEIYFFSGEKLHKSPKLKLFLFPNNSQFFGGYFWGYSKNPPKLNQSMSQNMSSFLKKFCPCPCPVLRKLRTGRQKPDIGAPFPITN